MPSSKKCSNLVGVSAGSGLARGALNHPWFALKIPHAALNLARAPLNNHALALNLARALKFASLAPKIPHAALYLVPAPLYIPGLALYLSGMLNHTGHALTISPSK